MTLTQLENFLYSHSRNEWLESPGMKVYVRKGVHMCSKTRSVLRCVDIANIQIANHNTGVFTKWYPGVRQIAINFGADAVYFESVLNQHFAAKLGRMGMYKEGTLGYFDLLREV